MFRSAVAGLVVTLVLAGVSGCSLINDECEGLGEYEDLADQTVTLLIPTDESQLQEAMRPFNECTGAQVEIRRP